MLPRSPPADAHSPAPSPHPAATAAPPNRLRPLLHDPLRHAGLAHNTRSNLRVAASVAALLAPAFSYKSPIDVANSTGELRGNRYRRTQRPAPPAEAHHQQPKQQRRLRAPPLSGNPFASSQILFAPHAATRQTQSLVPHPHSPAAASNPHRSSTPHSSAAPPSSTRPPHRVPPRIRTTAASCPQRCAISTFCFPGPCPSVHHLHRPAAASGPSPG